MQLKWGTYPFDANACGLSTQIEPILNEGNSRYENRVRVMVEGYLAGDGQAALTTASNLLINNLAIQGRDLIFYQDDGSISATSLLNATSISGVRIIDGPHFPKWQGAEYATERYFQFTAEASYPLADSLLRLVEFRESVRFSGGGPFIVHKNAVNSLPQKQIIYPATPFVAVQRGMAVGYRDYPYWAVPSPIWPAALKQSRDIEETGPRFRGNGYSHFGVSWNYLFESATILTGHPNVWRG